MCPCCGRNLCLWSLGCLSFIVKCSEERISWASIDEVKRVNKHEMIMAGKCVMILVVDHEIVLVGECEMIHEMIQ